MSPVTEPVSAAEFAAAMQPLGPFEPRPHIAVAVSGGADSMAACVLTRDWARRLGGEVLALVVDHGLRPESSVEALLTCQRLRRQSVITVLITLSALRHGPGLAVRARAARHAALEAACAERGIVHLVFGHHAADQAETLIMRMIGRSHPPGLAGMGAVVETKAVRRLRPLLAVPPGRLRATLGVRRIPWIDDPSNADPGQLRARLRARRDDPAGDGVATSGLVDAAILRGDARGRAEATLGDELGRRAMIFPQGHALLSPGPISAPALAALVVMLSGAERPPAMAQVERLAANIVPATLGGVRIIKAGRLGPGWLLLREPAACAPPIPASAGASWDGRFRLLRVPHGLATDASLTLGAWGTQAQRDRRGLPVAALQSQPVLRADGVVVCDATRLLGADPPAVIFSPANSACAARFLAAKTFSG